MIKLNICVYVLYVYSSYIYHVNMFMRIHIDTMYVCTIIQHKTKWSLSFTMESVLKQSFSVWDHKYICNCSHSWLHIPCIYLSDNIRLHALIPLFLNVFFFWNSLIRARLCGFLFPGERFGFLLVVPPVLAIMVIINHYKKNLVNIE